MKTRLILSAVLVTAIVAVPGCRLIRGVGTRTGGTGTTRTVEPSAPATRDIDVDSKVTRGTIYLLSGEKVATVARAVRPPAIATECMQELLAGPTAAETASGLGTAIPQGTRLLSMSVADGTANVNLSREFESGGGTLAMSARIAQVVFTATQFDSVTRVVFLIEGTPIESLGGEGLIVAPYQTRETCESMAPPVLIEKPAWGEIVPTGAEFELAGSANVFEGVFNIEVTDGDGLIVDSLRLNATSGTGTRGTFSTTTEMPASARAGTGEVVAWYASPKDGSRIVAAEIPIRVIAP